MPTERPPGFRRDGDLVILEMHKIVDEVNSVFKDIKDTTEELKKESKETQESLSVITNKLETMEQTLKNGGIVSETQI
jgi:prefoldin subunit 5